MNAIPSSEIAEPPSNLALVEENQSDSSNPAFVADPPLAALQQLPREQHRAYTVFMEWALAQVPVTIAELAACNNVSVPTVQRWKRFHRWDERVAQYHQLRLESTGVSHISRPSSPRPAPVADDAIDFRAEALALARSALHRWQQSIDENVTLPGVTRAIELALKLTGQDQPVEPEDPEKKSRQESFEQLLEKLYGEKARKMAAAEKAAAESQHIGALPTDHK